MNNNNRDVLLKIAEAIKDTTTIEQAVDNWLEDHPEATTTVQDGSITKAKLDENLQGTVDDFSDVQNTLVNSLYAAVDYTASVVEEVSYQQFVFSEIPAGKYLFVIESSAEIDIASVRFMHGTTQVAAYSTADSASPSKPLVYLLDYSSGTSTINRIRIYGVSGSATIRFRFIGFGDNNKSISNAKYSIINLGDFVENKAANASWLNGYSVQVQNPNRLTPDSGYYVAHLTVKKGDLILINFPNSSHLLNNGRYALSERVIYGEGVTDSAFNGIFVGGQQNYTYIAEKDMMMTVGGQGVSYLPSIYQYAVSAYAKSAEFAARRYQRFPFNETTEKLAITKASYNGLDSTRPKPLTLLHFSDIHNNVVNASAIKQFKSLYGEYLNDAICTGDMTGQNFASYLPIYGQDGYTDILLAIGNHDVYDADGTHDSDNQTYWATAMQKYNQYFAPSISDWGVTQPEGASTSGLCYYYKDYTNSTDYGYRLIVLDAMAFDDAQYNWLVSTLDDAKTNDLTVIIAEHFAPITGISDINGFETPFMSLLTGMENNYAVGRLTTTAGSALDAVDTFITGGGDFACWLCGHMHYDQIGTLVSHPNQIFIAIASASRSVVWEDQPRYFNTPSEDLFNIVSIDPVLKVIKIQRIGATVDDWGRIHDHVSVNYSTRTLIATS